MRRRGHAQLSGPRRPVEPREAGGQIGHGHLVVGLHRVAVLHVGPVGASERRLDRHHAGGRRGGVAEAGGPQHRRDVGHVLGAVFLQLGVVLQVVVAVGEAKSALTDIEGVARGLLRVAFDAPLNRCAADAELELPREVGGEILLGGNRVDRRELGRQRSDAQFVSPLLVHEGREEVADLLLRAACGARRLGGGLDQHAKLLLGVIVRLVESAVGRLVGRNFGLAEPGAVHVGEEIVLRAVRPCRTWPGQDPT